MKKQTISVGKPSLSGGAKTKIATAPTAGTKVKNLKGKSNASRGYDAGYAGGASGHAYAMEPNRGKGRPSKVSKYHSTRGKMV